MYTCIDICVHDFSFRVYSPRVPASSTASDSSHSLPPSPCIAQSVLSVHHAPSPPQRRHSSLQRKLLRLSLCVPLGHVIRRLVAPPFFKLGCRDPPCLSMGPLTSPRSVLSSLSIPPKFTPRLPSRRGLLLRFVCTGRRCSTAPYSPTRYVPAAPQLCTPLFLSHHLF